MSGAGRSRTLRRRLVAVALGVVVALAVTEVVLRVFGLGEPPESVRMLRNEADDNVLYHCYPTNPNGEFRPLPSLRTGSWKLAKKILPPVALPLSRASETPWCVEYRSATFGVRGPPISPRPRPGVLRIIGIGDSFGYGDGVPADKTVFAQLDTALGPRVEVLNCGRSGADVELNSEMLDWAHATYGGTRSVFVFIPNDIRGTPALYARLDRVYDLVSLRTEHLSAGSALSRVSRLAGVIVRGTRLRSLSSDTLSFYRDLYDPEHNGANLRALEERFRRLAQAPPRVALVLYPLMYGLEDYPLRGVHEKVAAMARGAGLPVLDLTPHFAGRDTDALRVHEVDHHPNGTAHGIAAQAIAGWLRDDVPGFVSPR